MYVIVLVIRGEDFRLAPHTRKAKEAWQLTDMCAALNHCGRMLNAELFSGDEAALRYEVIPVAIAKQLKVQGA